MRNIPIILLFALFVGLAVVSCDDSDTRSTAVTISLPSASVLVPYEGGTFSVKYGIGNAKDDGYLAASSEQDWITDFDFSVADTVSFHVAEQTERESRYGSVKLYYMLDADTLATNTISVSQEYNSQYTFTASYACGQCYGMKNNYNADGIWQYSVYFSDTPMDEYGTFVEGATYYFVDFWSNGEVEGIDSVALPAASYSFGKAGENDVISEASRYFIMNVVENEDDDEYSDWGEFVDGTVIVRRSGYSVTLTGALEDVWGGTHSISFNGELSLENFGLYTTLDGDETFGNISDVDCEARYYGDYYQTGTANWMLCIGSETGTGFTIDISADASYDLDGGIPEGTFSISSEGGVADTFLAGTIFNGYLSGTWLVSFDEDGALTAPYAPICDGTVEISASGDSYTITIDGTDDRENSITASWTGAPTIVDYRTSTTSLSRSGIRLLR